MPSQRRGAHGGARTGSVAIKPSRHNENRCSPLRVDPGSPRPETRGQLRQVDVLVSQGKSVAEAIRSIGVTEVTYYRWRQEFGGLKSDQVKRLKALETENTRLRRAISDLTLDKLILQEAARGNF